MQATDQKVKAPSKDDLEEESREGERQRMRRAGSQSNLKPKTEQQQAHPGKAVKFQDYNAIEHGESKLSAIEIQRSGAN